MTFSFSQKNSNISFFRFDTKAGQILIVTGKSRHFGALQYQLCELDKTPSGWAYQYQLKAAPDPSTYVFPIEKVIRQSKGQSLVKWLYYPAKYNEWIKTKTIKKAK